MGIFFEETFPISPYLYLLGYVRITTVIIGGAVLPRTISDLKLQSGNILLRRLTADEDAYEVVALGGGTFLSWVAPGAHLIASNTAAVMLDTGIHYIADKSDVQARDLYVPTDPQPDPEPDPEPDPNPEPLPATGVRQIFPSTCAIYQDISTAPVAADNSKWQQLIRGLKLSLELGYDAENQQLSYGIPINVVHESQPSVEVIIRPDEGWELVSSDFYPQDRGWLPLPTVDAKVENANDGGNDPDHHLCVLVVNNEDKPVRLIELWRANPLMRNGQHVGWTCQNYTTFDCSKDLPQRPLLKTSADAAGLPIFPFLFTKDDILTAAAQPNPADRHLGHALRITFSAGAIRQAFTFPATHYTPSNTTSLSSMPYGARFRLKASVNPEDVLPSWGKTDLAEGNLNMAYAEVLCNTLKKYGAIVCDIGTGGAIVGCPWTPAEFDPQSWVRRGMEGITMAHFEAVDTGPVYDKNNLAAATQASGLPVWEHS